MNNIHHNRHPEQSEGSRKRLVVSFLFSWILVPLGGFVFGSEWQES